MTSIAALLKATLIHLFDFSNYPNDSKFFDETNKKAIGKMRDDSEGK